MSSHIEQQMALIGRANADPTWRCHLVFVNVFCGTQAIGATIPTPFQQQTTTPFTRPPSSIPDVASNLKINAY
jgi:hypothetical protein